MKLRLFLNVGKALQRPIQIPSSPSVLMDLDEQQLEQVLGAAGVGCRYDSHRHAYYCCYYDQYHHLHCSYRSHP